MVAVYLAGVGHGAPDGPGTQVGQLSGSHARRGAGSARQMQPTDPGASAKAAIAKTLDRGERVQLTAAAVGSTLILTDRRLLLVRDGASYRPKSGVRSWPLGRDLSLRLGLTRGGSSLLAIGRDDVSVRVFVTSGQALDAAALIAECRRLSYADHSEDADDT